MRIPSIAAALAAAIALAGSTRPVTYLESSQVEAAFAKGVPLIEMENYKIHASRREGPGLAEVHERDTDIIHVLSGSAAFVTGGTMVGGQTTANEEIRGTAIHGGQTRRIAKGDVIVVPNGTPHWFKEVEGPMTYYVVKVRSVDGGGK
ncbi:MAG: hypothetical protein HYR60_29155 [Acidobacteria bacterium]|nr:hypothetical protein [Acidobacteriota bacterium]